MRSHNVRVYQICSVGSANTARALNSTKFTRALSVVAVILTNVGLKYAVLSPSGSAQPDSGSTVAPQKSLRKAFKSLKQQSQTHPIVFVGSLFHGAYAFNWSP
jgi:hypothetical protein